MTYVDSLAPKQQRNSNSTERTYQEEQKSSSVDDGLGQNPSVVPPSTSRHQVKVHLGDDTAVLDDKRDDGSSQSLRDGRAVGKKRLRERESCDRRTVEAKQGSSVMMWNDRTNRGCGGSELKELDDSTRAQVNSDRWPAGISGWLV